MSDIRCSGSTIGRWQSFFPMAPMLGSVSVHAAGAPPQLQSPDGRRSVNAVQTKSPIALDGVLDEDVWRAAEPAADFIQTEPHEGQPATERTDVRLVYDGDALYIGFRCFDTTSSGLIIDDIRQDFTPGEQDTFEVLLDTFADRRNGFVFVTNPMGAKSDAQIANEGRDVNTSWDGVWTVATRRDASGWSAEIRIPFKTLRFEGGADRIWGVNFSRRIRRKNEIDYWSGGSSRSGGSSGSGGSRLGHVNRVGLVGRVGVSRVGR